MSWCVQAAGCAVVGAACWRWWLGHTAASGDYTTGQVAACAGTLLVGCLLLAVCVNPAAVALGLTAGFSAAWTHEAAASDPTGLYLVGAGLLVMGMGTASVAVSWAGWELARRVHGRPRG